MSDALFGRRTYGAMRVMRGREMRIMRVMRSREMRIMRVVMTGRVMREMRIMKVKRAQRKESSMNDVLFGKGTYGAMRVMRVEK